MKRTYLIFGKAFALLSLLFMTAGFPSCSSGGDSEPDIPEEPEKPVVTDETVTLSVGFSYSKDDEAYITARAAAGDLFGVNIMQWNGDVPMLHQLYYPYAAGVFDDLDEIKFKFVKGRTYSISFNYTPDAKSFVYQMKNGTYGYPFSSIYGLHEYTLNTPVYDKGDPNTEGYQGEVLSYIAQGGYQTNESGYFWESYAVGTTPRYLGYVNNIKIDEDTKITIPLKLYAAAVKLNVGNFSSGKIKLVIPAGAPNDLMREYSPGDDMTQMFWINCSFPHEHDYLAKIRI